MVRIASVFLGVLALMASLAACSTEVTDATYIPGLAAPVPRPDPRWGFRASVPNDGAAVQFVAAAPDDAQETVEATHAWYEDLMYDLGWNKSEESPPQWSHADRYHFGTTSWHEELDGRDVGAMIWLSGGARRVTVRIYCCDASAGDPGP